MTRRSAARSATDLGNWVHKSWLRSQRALVDIDRPRAAYVQAWPTDTTLTRAAGPVIDALAAEIENEPVCLILTDAKGVVLDRRGGDSGLLRMLDRVDLAPGFLYAEGQVGTNGIGTALEVGAPLQVDGAEHYNERLRQFSCAGALVTHPGTGAVLGVVDITTDQGNSNSLLLSFAKMAALRIQQRIAEESSALDQALLGDYYAACRRSGRPVIAVGEEVLMMNSLTHQHFDSRDQAAIIGQTRDVRGRTDPVTLLADLPSGITARLSYQPTFVGDVLAGGIVQIREQSPAHSNVIPALGPVRLSGCVGGSATWRHTCNGVLSALHRDEWLVVEGEPGSGKAHLLRSAHSQAHPSRHLVVLDATAQEPAELLDRVAADGAEVDLVIRRIEHLDDESTLALAQLLQEHLLRGGADSPWVGLTLSSGATETENRLQLLRLFPKSAEAPPLRHRAEDLPALTRHLLDRMGAPELRLTPAALNQLSRLPWPGNVTQLRTVLESLSRRHRSGAVDLSDLPAQCRATTRRTLTKLESLERDAVVNALSLHAGDKAAAATELGMSRATIYRKIRDFGIVT